MIIPRFVLMIPIYYCHGLMNEVGGTHEGNCENQVMQLGYGHLVLRNGKV